MLIVEDTRRHYSNEQARPDLDEEEVATRFNGMVPRSASAILGGEQSDLNVNSLIR
jgi:hypothetical protein